MTWDGKDRRQSQREDRDLLIEIHAIVGEMKNSAKEDRENMKAHIAKDDENFIGVHKRINKLSWYAALGAGAVFALEFFKEKIFK